MKLTYICIYLQLIYCEYYFSIYECNVNCACKKNCNNRVVQNGIKHQLQIFKTPDKLVISTKTT